MKKAFLLLMLLIGISTTAQQIEKGSKMINFGIGTGESVLGSFEFAVSDKVTVGPYLAIWEQDYQYSSGISTELNYFSYGVLGNYHFFQDPVWDVYGGGVLGFERAQALVIHGEKNSGKITISNQVLGFVVGGRYLFSEKFAVRLELGLGGWLGHLGLTYKL